MAAKQIAVILNHGFADWEAAFLTSTAREMFGCEIGHFTPGGGEVVSIGQLRAKGDGDIAALKPDWYDALIVVGSERWADPEPLDISKPLREAEAAGKVVGAICAGTLAAARAGLLDGRTHTSNEAAWLDHVLPSYPGREHYRPSNRAVRYGNLITAPGSAPASFALAVLEALFPDRLDELAQVAAMFNSEHQPA
jgi:putative intracellular protease/amidase